MKEVINSYKNKYLNLIFYQLKAKKNKYFVLSCHREENIDINFDKIVEIINNISSYYKLPIFLVFILEQKRK